MTPTKDWQVDRRSISQRAGFLLQTGAWSDCRFIVGSEPNDELLKAHRLVLAMSSPVFEAMFFGGMPEKDPVCIEDVQPEAFKSLLKYIYTDEIDLNSFDQACELCYAGKKYMLPHLVTECTKYIWSDLYPRNACRAYEFAKLFEERVLMERCLQIMQSQTKDVLNETNYDDIDLSTLITLFEQDSLNIDSELDLFNAISKYASRLAEPTNMESTVSINRVRSQSCIPASTSSEAPPAESSNQSIPTTVSVEASSSFRQLTIRDAIKRIRFLTLLPNEFAEGPGASTLLTQDEKFAILMNISSRNSGIPIPEGFSTLPRRKRYLMYDHQMNQDQYRSVRSRDMVKRMKPVIDAPNKFYCRREIVVLCDCANTATMDCSVTFSSDKNIRFYGIQVPSQHLPLSVHENLSLESYNYGELLYATLLDSEGSRISYTHFTARVPYSSILDIWFNRPVVIQKNKTYKICVVLNKIGVYPIGTAVLHYACNDVSFSFCVGNPEESVRDAFIRSIIFSMPYAE